MMILTSPQHLARGINQNYRDTLPSLNKLVLFDDSAGKGPEARKDGPYVLSLMIIIRSD